MKNLVIIGTGGFAREVYFVAKQSAGYEKEWSLKGFIKDESYSGEIESFERCYPEGILGTIANYTVSENDVFFCAVAETNLKIRFVEEIKEKGGEFANIIHNSAIIQDFVTLGEGVHIGPHCTVSCHVRIGDYTSVLSSVALGHDAVIGDFCHLGSFTHFGGFSSIGSRTTIHPQAAVMPKIFVAEDTVIGAGSLVVRSVKIPGQSLFGSPAKVLIS